MIKLRCSNKNCKYIWFSEKNNFCPKCSSKSKKLVKEEAKRIEKIKEVIRNKKPHMK